MAKETDIRRAAFIDAALKHAGYQCRPGSISYFGGLTGYQGLPWDGSFVDVVARDAGLVIPSCVYSPSGLAEFINGRRWHAKPQPGDIVFFTWSTGEKFGSPHVGIVTDVTDWQTKKSFKSIEAQINSGLPRGSKEADGVYIRTRYGHDTIGFGRPDFGKRPGREEIANGQENEERPGRGAKIAGGQPVVRLSNLLPGKHNKEIERLQLALSATVGLVNANKGYLDGQTVASYARWQRINGYVGDDAKGLPDIDSLRKLGNITGFFTVA